jgi:2-dehydropantoate 2-reductase
MKIIIIGSGNIGCLLGTLLTKGGQDVTLVEIREDIVKVIEKEGIRIDMSNGQSVHAMVKITNNINALCIADLVILAVKSNSTRSALEGAKPIIGKDTWVMSVQNGAGNIETITEVLGDDSNLIGGVFFCVVTPSSTNKLSWVVGTGGLKFGPADGKISPRVKEVAEIFRKAGLSVDISTKVQELIWSKVLQNVPLALSTALRLTNDEFVTYPHAKELIVRMAQECVAVTKAMGITLDHPEDPINPLLNTIQKFHDSGTKPKSSMLQDLERGRKTEIDAINGSIVREGKRLGVPTPVNEVMMMLVKIQEEKNCI